MAPTAAFSRRFAMQRYLLIHFGSVGFSVGLDDAGIAGLLGGRGEGCCGGCSGRGAELGLSGDAGWCGDIELGRTVDWGAAAEIALDGCGAASFAEVLAFFVELGISPAVASIESRRMIFATVCFRKISVVASLTVRLVASANCMRIAYWVFGTAIVNDLDSSLR